MFNIFQGNELLLQTVAKALGYEPNQEYSWFTKDIYFQTYFYLSQRFGSPNRYDTDNEAGAWTFKVKKFIIEIRLNGSWVKFMIYGKKSNRHVDSPYMVIYQRKVLQLKGSLIPIMVDETKWEKNEVALADKLYDEFAKENQIDESITDEQFGSQFGMKWFDCVQKYNHNIVNIDYIEVEKKYGKIYQNSYTRSALRALDKFIKNMLTPIYVRDVPYNIKGELRDGDYNNVKRYENNVVIEYIP